MAQKYLHAPQDEKRGGSLAFCDLQKYAGRARVKITSGASSGVKGSDAL
jgi:hypothetical protein